MVNADTRLADVVGGRSAKALEKAFGYTTVDAALRHYPRRYAQRGELTDFADLRVGEDVTVMAEVMRVHTRRAARRTGKGRPVLITEVVIGDSRRELTLTFFNQVWRGDQLSVGRVGLFAGRVNSFRGGLQLVHPDFDLLPDDPMPSEGLQAPFAGSLIPIYPASSSVPSWKVAGIINVLLSVVDDLVDPLPQQVLAANGLVDLASALRMVHRPIDSSDISRGFGRLRWEEAFLLQVELGRRRLARQARSAVPRHPVAGGLVAALEERLPFELTAGQRLVSEQIAADMSRTHPMLRLLQGDVGSGKTVVALRAMLACVDAGAQAALLAPTEVLAAQHYATVMELLGPLAQRGTLLGDAAAGTSVVLLTGSAGAAARREALAQTANGSAGIVIGTHALMSEGVDFADLGLVVVDEQHRFGVEQRAALAAKTSDGVPHTLVMTATPIPRTVAMTVFGDVDVSVLAERPANRAGVVTHVVPAVRPAYLERVWQRVREEVAAGHQVYVVCPRVEADAEEVRPPGYPPTSVADLLPYLAEGPLSGLRLRVMHGKLPAAEKEAAMAAFAAGPGDPDGCDVLVSTTVIEVGVDVPNATGMIIIDADRFGVSSLHQLRGRVGRGSEPGICLLVTAAEAGTPAYERLEALAATEDGFRVAEIDLRARREGDVLGAAQSGRNSSLRLLSVLDDVEVIASARQAATDLLAADPGLAESPDLAAAVVRLAAAGEFLEKS